MISIRKGIELPIAGSVKDPVITFSKPDAPIAVLGTDYLGLKPTMMIQEGDTVKKGQALFEDKKNPGVVITAPVSGTIQSINRGERRRLLSVIIEPTDNDDSAAQFEAQTQEAITQSDAESVKQRLQEAGCWAFFRARPFSKIPPIDATPHSIFVNTMDSNPLALNPMLTLAGREDDYLAGLEVLSKLTDGNINVCYGKGETLPTSQNPQVKLHGFTGIHPVGLVGTHIHFIDAVGLEKTVWHLDLQDLLAIGHLFLTGEIDNTRVISVAGPGILEPKFMRIIQGVNLSKLLQGNLAEGEQRIISGSIFAGRKVEEPQQFLGAYDRQVVVLPEGRDTIFLELLRPGTKTYSKTRAYIGHFLKKTLPFTTSVQGSPRPVLPFGIYESVMPLDILPTLLIKSLIIKDTDTASQLGALELDEEDMALLTYVDPGKHDFGAILRENLEQIEKDG